MFLQTELILVVGLLYDGGGFKVLKRVILLYMKMAFVRLDGEWVVRRDVSLG